MSVGAHIDKQKTLCKTIDKIIEYGGNSLQFFTSNPKSKEVANIDKILKEKDDVLSYDGIRLVIHSSYIINMGSPLMNGKKMIDIEDTYGFKNIITDLIVAHELNAIGTIVHVGKNTQKDKEDALKNMYNFVKTVLRFIEDKGLKSKLILETGAGQGTEMLVDIDEFINFYNMIDDNERFGLCFDTAHVYASGQDLVKSYKKIQKNTNNGICVIHLNGSKVDYGKRVDRHDTIFDSKIPIKELNKIIQLGNISENMIILETPQPSPEEIKHVKSIID